MMPYAGEFQRTARGIRTRLGRAGAEGAPTERAEDPGSPPDAFVTGTSGRRREGLHAAAALAWVGAGQAVRAPTTSISSTLGVFSITRLARRLSRPRRWRILNSSSGRSRFSGATTAAARFWAGISGKKRIGWGAAGSWS